MASTQLSADLQTRVLALAYCYSAYCDLSDYHLQNIRHTDSSWMSMRRRVCEAGLVIRKAIDMTLSGPLCFILSLSAARLIHLQLSRLVEQVKGNVVLRRGLNPQSSPSGCGGSDRWARVTCPGVFVSSCCFCESLPRPLATRLQLLHPAPAPRCCQMRAGHLCLWCH